MVAVAHFFGAFGENEVLFGFAHGMVQYA